MNEPTDELALREDDHGVIPHAGGLLEVIARAAADPRVDVTKIEALLRMQMQVSEKQAELAFSQAMARLQPIMPRITKYGAIIVGGVTRSTYAKIEDIDAAIRPLYSAEGFSISWNTEPSTAGTTVLGKLRHNQGHSEAYRITLANDTSGSKNATQGSGSTFQYGKRYLLCAMFNIITIDEDDDAAGESVKPITEEQVRTIEDHQQAANMNPASKTKFLEYMEVSALSEITKGNFDKAINALKVKARKS